MTGEKDEEEVSRLEGKVDRREVDCGKSLEKKKTEQR